MGAAVMGDWRTSVQLTQLDHEIGVKQSSSVSKGTSGDGMSSRITNVCSNGKPDLFVMVESV